MNEEFFLAFFTDGDHFDNAEDFDDVGGFRVWCAGDVVQDSELVLFAAAQFPGGGLDVLHQWFSVGGFNVCFVQQLAFDGLLDARMVFFGDVLEVFADAFGKNDLERHGLNSSRNSGLFCDYLW